MPDPARYGVRVLPLAPGVEMAEVQCLKRLYRVCSVSDSPRVSQSFVLVSDCTGLIEMWRFSPLPLDGSSGSRVLAHVSVVR